MSSRNYFMLVEALVADKVAAPGYNATNNPNALWNQWVHWGYLKGWYSYEFYAAHSRELTAQTA